MRSLQTLVVFESSIMDPDTFKLIRKLCVEFQLQPDIEFTCYEAYTAYFKRFFPDLETQFKQTTLESNGTMIKRTNQLIEQVLDDVEKTSLLHILALISICAKYVNGFRCEQQLFKNLSKYLQHNGTPYSTREIRNTEYVVFKWLGFNIKPSELYSLAIDLATKITHRNRELIRFDSLHDSCVSLLRLIYLYRKKIDEIFHYVEKNTYGINGNEKAKLAAATVYASTMLIYPQSGNIVLNEIVDRTYLNESLVRKLGQSVHDFYLECTRC